MEKELDIRCWTCHYSVLNLKEDETVECHKYAPRKLFGTGTGYEAGMWPILHFDDGCGEWVLENTWENNNPCTCEHPDSMFSVCHCGKVIV